VASHVGRELRREMSKKKYRKHKEAHERQRVLDGQRRLVVSRAGSAAAQMKPAPAAAPAPAVPNVKPGMGAHVPLCGKWMPRARVRCTLSRGHAGACRSQR